jgi:hypothetical protein
MAGEFMNVLQIKNHLFKTNGLVCSWCTQGIYFEKAIFRVRGGLVFGQPRGLRSADSKNLTAGYLTVTSKTTAKDMQKKHEVMHSKSMDSSPASGVQRGKPVARQWMSGAVLYKKRPLSAALGAAVATGHPPRKSQGVRLFRPSTRQ